MATPCRWSLARPRGAEVKRKAEDQNSRGQDRLRVHPDGSGRRGLSHSGRGIHDLSLGRRIYAEGHSTRSGASREVIEALKQSGMRWTVDGANDIIVLRCCQLSNRWEESGNFARSADSRSPLSNKFDAHLLTNVAMRKGLRPGRYTRILRNCLLVFPHG
jgi:hypothetical protein